MLRVAKEAFAECKDDNAPRLGAALAYYSDSFRNELGTAAELCALVPERVEHRGANGPDALLVELSPE